MKLSEIITSLKLKCLTEPKDFTQIEVTGTYVSDMLSCVMVGAQSGEIWVTLIASQNIVAVASLLDLPAIIITEGALPNDETLQQANRVGVNLFSSSEKTYPVAGALWSLGL
jgi:serine kinase of HPr protein (carbohydrate metabolism regulator)